MTEQAVVPVKNVNASTINWVAIGMVIATGAKLIGAPVDESMIQTIITAGTGLAAIYVWARNRWGAPRALTSQLPAK